jgi:4-diphosphocytidyl-2-C-methyl-D-erythritol kinase
MIKREYIKNIDKIVNMNLQSNDIYDNKKLAISQYKDKTIFFTKAVFYKTSKDTKLGKNYFLLLPFLLNKANKIYRDTQNHNLILSIDINNYYSNIVHTINDNGDLIDISFKPIKSKVKEELSNQIKLLEQKYIEELFNANYSDISYAKVNIFLKIVGIKDGYHLLASRFVRVKNLYDTISFEKGRYDSFILEGNFGCDMQTNTIYKAYIQLCDISTKVKKYFSIHKVKVDKTIKEFAGLGGGSSNCATFILMVNDVCNLNLSLIKLSEIGLTIGADVPFFIYEYDSANVSGIGQIVEQFDEEILDIDTFTPQISCDTGAIFKEFSKNFYKQCDDTLVQKLFKTKSIDIYNSMDITQANDLYQPALSLNNNLDTHTLNIDKNSFFSGSGSSFFTIN